MNVLFLDDDEQRTASFTSRFPDAVTVETAEACIARLRDGTGEPERPSWDLVFLDHDLGGEFFVDSRRADTGMEVVRWILENRPKIARIVIHTHNEFAGYEMEQELTRAGYDTVQLPFGTFDPVGFLEEPPAEGRDDATPR